MVGTFGETLLWESMVGLDGGTLRLSPMVRPYGGTLWWDLLVGLVGGTLRLSPMVRPEGGTLWWDPLAQANCRQAIYCASQGFSKTLLGVHEQVSYLYVYVYVVF